MSYRDILPAEIESLRAQDGLLIFDIRDPHSYAQGHLDGAQAVSDAAIKQLVRDRQRARPILVYCYHGNSSREMCQFIAGLGYANVLNLAGGWQAWQQFLAAPADASPLAAWMQAQGFAPGDLNSRIDNGMSPLMWAALHGERAMVDALLAAGADPNHVNDDEHHALWFACVHGDPGLVQQLIAHGADVDNQNVNGATCAIYAASTGKLEVLQRLVEAGADLARATNAGYSVMESASTLPVLKYLRGLLPDRRELSTA